jgi:hypothetical protein
MTFESLDQFRNKGSFGFKPDDKLSKVCDAPTDKSGVYIVYGFSNGVKELIYIGISGTRQPDGTLKTRSAGFGGMKDRIVNGHQFGKIPRKRSWPDRMRLENIDFLEVHWYVTYDETVKYFPRDIEITLLRIYESEHHRLPRWNKEL